MDASVAVAALEASLASDSATPDHGAVDRNAYLAAQQADLRKHLVAPREVLAQAGEWAQNTYGWSSEPRPMVLLAYDPEGVGNSLLYDLASGKFAHAYGHPESGSLDLAGHSSTDALFEWLV
jgi:hypothetical protein